MGNKYGGFPGGGMGNMQNLLKQAQKMQADMQKKQESAVCGRDGYRTIIQ